MPYNTSYKMDVLNNENELVEIIISDTLSGTTGSPSYMQMKCTRVEEIITNSDEDKFSVIKGKRLEVDFWAEVNYNLNLFIGANDDQFLVEAFIGGVQIFSGFLITDATHEAFLPPTTYTVQLTASDNLGLLKDIPLTKPDGTNPRGKYRLVEYVSWALLKTGFEFPIKFVYNLRPEQLTSAGTHTFHEVYLDAKTFEADINESISCYEVLERLLKGCFLTQHNNEWWIVRVDEINGGSYLIQSFAYDGTIGALASTSTLSKNIGKTESIKFITKDAEVMPERPVKFAKVEYRFEFPKEIVDNFDFSRGSTWYSIVSVDMGLYIKTYATTGDFPTTGEYDTVYYASGSGLYYKWTASGYVNITGAEVPQGFAYSFDDWTKKKGNPDSPTTAPMDAYVIKIRQYGDEKARYVHLTNPTTASVTRSYMESNGIPVGRYDKFTCSVDFRFPTNITSGGAPFYVIMAVRLKGEDGSNWWLGHSVNNGVVSPPRWMSTNSTWTNNSFLPGPAIPLQFNGARDTTEWQSCSWDAPPVPVNGEIFVQLCGMNSQSNVGSTWDDTPIHYANFQFDYSPYINGSYQKYSSHYNKVSQSINTKRERSEEVRIADSPKKLFKGALLLKTGSLYYLTTNWYNYLAGTSGELGIAMLTKYNAFEFWNQQNRIIRKFQGTLRGIDSATPTDMPGLLHNYIITTSSDHTTNKTFMLLSYSQNLDTCEWTGIFAEVMDDTAGKLYNSDHEFKYVTND